MVAIAITREGRLIYMFNLFTHLLVRIGTAPRMQICRLPWSKSVGHPCTVLKTEHFVCINDISKGKDIFLWLPMGFIKL